MSCQGPIYIHNTYSPIDIQVRNRIDNVFLETRYAIILAEFTCQMPQNRYMLHKTVKVKRAG